MANRLIRFIRRHLVGDVPPALDLCFNCQRAECSAEEYRDCTRRKLGRDELPSPPLAPAARMTPPRGV